MESYEGEVLDCRYLVEGLVGTGGMGVVYQGKHIVVGRSVAIKFLSPEFSTQQDIVARFYREAQTAAAIGHKNIVDILDVGISDRHEPYFVMEYLEGECLSTLLRRTGPIGLAAACAVLEPVLLAISAAHAKGIVHRDLKPDNIFLVHDAVDNTVSIKIIDFGISKLIHVAENDKLTHAGSALGTPCYMSPEQASCASDIDHRSDIYTIGVILYEMLTGEPPHDEPSSQETMLKIISEAPRDPAAVYPDFPEAARPVIERAMARDPNERYRDASEMLAALQSLDAFGVRREALSGYALGMTERQCAVGDLGRVIGPGEGTDVPEKVLSELVERYTPKGWTASRSKHSRSWRRPSNRLAWLFLSVALLLTAALLFLVLGAEETETAASAVVPPAPSPAPAAATDTPRDAPPEPDVALPREVRIAVTGTPPRSTILFGDVVVPSNTFYVPFGEAPVTLTVEAPGYDPFETELTPDRDRSIPVEMARAASRRRSASGAKASSGDGKESDRFIQGRRKTEIIREFE